MPATKKAPKQSAAKKAADEAKVAANPKPKAEKASPNYEAIADRIRDELAEQGDLHLGGDVNAPNVVARQALDTFDALRYTAQFQLIVELAYKDGHVHGQAA